MKPIPQLHIGVLVLLKPTSEVRRRSWCVVHIHTHTHCQCMPRFQFACSIAQFVQETMRTMAASMSMAVPTAVIFGNLGLIILSESSGFPSKGHLFVHIL